MTDPRESDPTGADRLGRLLRAAGRRPDVPEERLRRTREAAREAWRATVDERRRATHRRAWRRALVAAAAVAIVAVATWTWTRRTPAPLPTTAQAPATIERIAGVAVVSSSTDEDTARPLSAGDRVVAPAEWTTMADGRMAARLPSGHRIRLDRGTRLAWTGGRHLRLLAGAVYVESDPDGRVPDSVDGLVVETPRGDVHETGTRYEVRLAADETLEVRVRDGAVTVAADRDRPAVTVDAGYGVAVHVDGSITEAAVAPDGEAWTWIEDVEEPFALHGRTLAEFLDWAERERGARFRFADRGDRAETRAIVLEGGSLDGLATDDAVRAVLSTCGWTVRRTDGAYEIGDTAHFSD